MGGDGRGHRWSEVLGETGRRGPEKKVGLQRRNKLGPRRGSLRGTWARGAGAQCFEDGEAKARQPQEDPWGSRRRLSAGRSLRPQGGSQDRA